MLKWKDFLIIEKNLRPVTIKNMLKEIPNLKFSNELYDSITDELHLDFEFESYPFSFHNPYSGVYGLFFFYFLKKNDPSITKRLKTRLEDLFFVYSS